MVSNSGCVPSPDTRNFVIYEEFSKVNKSELKVEYTEDDLAVAIEHTVRAAVDLRISETDLLERLSKRWYSRITSDDESLVEVELERVIFHPGAGP